MYGEKELELKILEIKKCGSILQPGKHTP